MSAYGLKSNTFPDASIFSSCSLVTPWDVPKVLTQKLTGLSTPIAYATCIWQRSASPAATMFFAAYRA